MEPKAYSASPVGANFLVVVFNGSSGSIVFDETLPFSDVNAHVRGVGIGLGHTFGLFGKLALASAAMPYAWADVTGKIELVGRSGKVRRVYHFRGTGYHDHMRPIR